MTKKAKLTLRRPRYSLTPDDLKRVENAHVYIKKTNKKFFSLANECFELAPESVKGQSILAGPSLGQGYRIKRF